MQDGWKMRNVSVVLVAERRIDTETLDADILRDAGITPFEWEGTVSDESRGRNFLDYGDGITISAQNTRCVVQQNFNDEADLGINDEIYQVAKRYIDATRLVRYRFLGLNWSLYQRVANPRDWFIAHLLNPNNSLEHYGSFEIKLTKPFGRSSCNFTFTSRADEVVLNCNYHFDLSRTAPDVAIDQWSECDQNLWSVLKERFSHSL